MIGGIAPITPTITPPNASIAGVAIFNAIANGIIANPNAPINAIPKNGNPLAAAVPNAVNPTPNAPNPADAGIPNNDIAIKNGMDAIAKPAANANAPNASEPINEDAIAVNPTDNDVKLGPNCANGVNPINNKNGIDAIDGIAAIPNAATANEPINVDAILLRPVANPLKLVSNCFNGVNPINNKNGIDGSAIINAGPANATAPIPANTLPSPISFKPSANDFNPPPLLEPPLSTLGPISFVLSKPGKSGLAPPPPFEKTPFILLPKSFADAAAPVNIPPIPVFPFIIRFIKAVFAITLVISPSNPNAPVPADTKKPLIACTVSAESPYFAVSSS